MLVCSICGSTFDVLDKNYVSSCPLRISSGFRCSGMLEDIFTPVFCLLEQKGIKIVEYKYSVNGSTVMFVLDTPDLNFEFNCDYLPSNFAGMSCDSLTCGDFVIIGSWENTPRLNLRIKNSVEELLHWADSIV